MGDLEWAQGIQGLTQGALTGIALNRQRELIDIQKQQSGPLMGSKNIVLQKSSELLQEQGSLEPLLARLEAGATLTDDETKLLVQGQTKIAGFEKLLAQSIAYLLEQGVPESELRGAFPTGQKTLSGGPRGTGGALGTPKLIKPLGSFRPSSR